MTLKFTCPSGHVISCEDSFSGKPAKCPQCSTKFVVPPPGQEKAEPLPAKQKAQAAGDSNAQTATATKEDTIVFLCPSGHKLNGPARLQGKAGQCPECGAKFRIPSYDEAEDEDDLEEDEEILTGEEVGDDEIFDADDIEQIEIVDDLEFADFGAVQDGYEFADVPIDDAPLSEFAPALPEIVEGAHALSGIFSLLWQQRHYGGAIEMQLAEGELLTPDYYSAELSHATHGVFAMRGKDGTFTITSIPWDSVLRVSLRKTEELPPGLFEE